MAGHPEAVASERVTEVRGLAAGRAETVKAQRKHLLNEVVASPGPFALSLPSVHRIKTVPGS